MNRRRHLTLLVASLALAMLGFATSAFAAPAAWETVHVTAHDEGDSAVLLVTGSLPEGTPLPAEVELAVPAGLQLQWAGEVLGGDPAQDPDVTYQVAKRDGLDVYSFTLTKARIGQLEVISPATFAAQGDLRSAQLEWTTHQNVPSLSLYVRVPTGSQIVQTAEGAGLQPSQGGYSYYGREFKDITAGEPVSLAVTFKPAAVAPAAGNPTAPTSQPANGTATLVPLVLLAIVGVAGVLLIRGINRKMSGRRSADTSSAPAGAPRGREQSASTASSGASAAPRKVSSALVITVAIIGALVVAGVLASGSSSSVQELPDGYAQQYQQGDECQVLTLKLTEAPSKSTAEKLFEALRPAQPLRAMIYKENPRIEVGFCESQTNQQAVQSALAATGLTGEVVAPSAP